MPRYFAPKGTHDILPSGGSRTDWTKQGWITRIAEETPEWRGKRLEAENPQTSATHLVRLANEIRDFLSSCSYPEHHKVFLLSETLAAHPNVPLHLVADLLDWSPFAAARFCQNPVAPLLLLNDSAFVASLSAQTQHELVSEADVPPILVQMLATGGAARSEAVEKAARFHVVFAHENATQEGWEQQLRNYWKEGCATHDWRPSMRQAHINLVEIGLAPPWAAGLPPIPDPDSYVPLPNEVEDWMRFSHTVGSPEEADLLKRICPGVEYAALMAHSLRADTTPAEMHDLLDFIDRSDIILKQTKIPTILLKHPSTDADIIRRLIRTTRLSVINLSLTSIQPQTPSDVLADLLLAYSPNDSRLARRHANAPEDALIISRNAFLRDVQRQWHNDSAFISFVWSLVFMSCKNEHPYHLPDLSEKVESKYWWQRIEAVFIADVSTKPIYGDVAGRTGINLLHHLSNDGNRLVCAAARARLNSSSYRFSL